MITSFRKFIAPPTFDDPGEKHQARFLNTILLSFIAANIVMAIPILTSSNNPAPGLFAVGFAIFLWSTFRLILKRGNLRLASTLTISGAWLLETALLFLLDGLRRPIFSIYFLIIISAAIILSQRASYIVAGATAIASIIAYLADAQGLLPPPIIPTSDFSGLIQNILFLFVTTIIMSLAVSSLNKALKQFRQSEQAQQVAIQDLEEMQSTLNQTVEERTASLQHRSLQLQTAAEVGRATATFRERNELLDEAVKLISSRFNFYHAGIYLLDEKNEYAILEATNSEAGKGLLAQKHRLAIGGNSIVGNVASQQKAHLALDTGEDAFYLGSEDFPETRSEMALPLLVRDNLLGVLDVQSKRKSAFTVEDIAVLQILADQIAVSIDNAQLFAQHDESLKAVQRAYGEYNQEGWARLLQERPSLGFLSTAQNASEETTEKWTPGMEKAHADGEITIVDKETIAIPIILRDHSIGAIRLKKAEGSPSWSVDEIELMNTLTNQLEIALESARLFDQSQRRAARERVIGESSARIRETLDIESVLETAAQELHKILGKVETEVWIDAE
ncbi:MAG: GAF domain-containing protein [Anaerolineae bacterium]|nr:GAF domain-containing protein [Anaerolineae bacterium]MBT7781481.1 GAF domain-containing protein [Anaerolineae bacterium]